jgi:hypothetical protein
MSLEFEKDFDDEVYEDSFYEEEEELSEDAVEDDSDDDEFADDELDPDDEDGKVKMDYSFVCDDCDYRWDDSILQDKNEFGETDEVSGTVCPMCGSMNVTQI